MSEKNNEKKPNDSGTKIQRSATRQFLIRVLVVVIITAGIGFILYPFVVDALNDRLDNAISHQYQKDVHSKKNDELSAFQEEKARKERLRTKALDDPFSAESLENAKVLEHNTTFYVKHTIGVLYIPKISQSLPIFDSTKEDFLSKGAAWMANTDYPKGGKNRHTVISGHRGLPSAMLFTDLPKLQNGDVFILALGKKYLAYKVVSQITVKPENLDVLKRAKDRDLTSLLTCTPYMVNSHRLIVTGERTPFKPSMMKDINGIQKKKDNKKAALIAAVVALIAAFVWLIWRSFQTMCIARNQYELRIRLQDFIKDNDLPLTGYEFALYDKKGKRQKKRNQEPLVTTIDEETNDLVITNLNGITYMIRQSNRQDGYTPLPPFIIKVKKTKDEFFHLKPRIKHRRYRYILKFVNGLPHIWAHEQKVNAK
jgi:sortase A